MQCFLAHLHKNHPKAKTKSKEVFVKAPKEPQILIFGNALSNYGTDGQHGYDPSRHVNLTDSYVLIRAAGTRPDVGARPKN